MARCQEEVFAQQKWEEGCALLGLQAHLLVVVLGRFARAQETDGML
jgi:hypothetical protein